MKAVQAAVAALPSIPQELIDQFVSDPMSAEAPPPGRDNHVSILVRGGLLGVSRLASVRSEAALVILRVGIRMSLRLGDVICLLFIL